jgi:hypothetical protein
MPHARAAEAVGLAKMVTHVRVGMSAALGWLVRLDRRKKSCRPTRRTTPRPRVWPHCRREPGRGPRRRVRVEPRRVRNGDPRAKASSQRAFVSSVRHCTLGNSSEHARSQAAPGEGRKQLEHTTVGSRGRTSPRSFRPNAAARELDDGTGGPSRGRNWNSYEPWRAEAPIARTHSEPNPESAELTRLLSLTT